MEPQTTTTNVPDWFLPSIAAHLSGSLSVNDLRLTVLPGSGNNRVFRVQAGSQVYFVKWYFAATEDPRDRLHSEWAFANFAWRHGLRHLAQPIACDPTRRFAIFEFIFGRRLTPTDVNGTYVRSALQFLLELNQHRAALDAVPLPAASEACFSMATHIDCVQRRIQLLKAAAREAQITTAASDFINHQLALAADRVVVVIRQRLESTRQSERAEISPEERILSPSDFGFHNALLDADGRLRFLDFEYAGWDDPAKTVCDFFSQVAVPVPYDFWSHFVAGIEPIAGPAVARRAELLRPLHLIKWCCIVLNPLLRIGRDRRQFSGGDDCAITEAECLDRARRILAVINEGKSG